MVLYWIAQFAGGALGAFFYKELQTKTGCTQPCGGVGPGCKLTSGNVFGIEFIATFLLVFTVFGSAVDPKSGAGNYAPMAIGFSLFVAAMSIGPYTGAGLNPARTLCPALIHDCWEMDGFGDSLQWAYVLAQFAGGASAGVVYYFAFLNRPDDGNKKASSAFQFMATETKAVKERLEKAK